MIDLPGLNRRDRVEISFPDITDDKFHRALVDAGFDLSKVRKQLSISPKIPDIALLKRYNAVREYAKGMQGTLTSGESVLSSISSLGIRLTTSFPESVARARIADGGGVVDAGIDFTVDVADSRGSQIFDSEVLPQLPEFIPQDLDEAAKKSKWDFVKLKEELGVSLDTNLVEIFLKAKHIDSIKSKFIENLKSRGFRICDSALDLNANPQELITLLYLAKNEIAKNEDYSEISALNVDDDINTTIKLISSTFGGFPVNGSFPRFYSFEASKMFEDILKNSECKPKLQTFKEKLGIKANRSYYDIFQHYGLLNQLKSKIIVKLKESGGIGTPVANHFGITYPTLKTLLVALDVSLETEKAEERIRKEVREELDSLFKENVLYLATRYAADVRTIIWGLIGSKLKAKYDYDEEMIKKILDEQIIHLVDERAKIESEGSKRVPQAKKTKLDEDDKGPENFSIENLDQRQIGDISAKIEKKSKSLKDKGMQDIVNDQAFVFIKELEEHYIFKKFTHYKPQELKVSDVLDEIERAKKEISRREQPGVLPKVLDSIKKDVEEAGRIQEILWNAGIKKSTDLFLYQLLAVYRIEEERRFLLADEMGAGKTLAAIATFLQSDEDEALILGPNVALTRWMDDIGDHTDRKMEVVILSGRESSEALQKNKNLTIINKDEEGNKLISQESRCRYLLNRKLPEKGTKRIILMNDDILPELKKIREVEKLPPLKLGFLALDEVHRLKNPDVARTQAVFGDGTGEAGIEANYVIGLTATPIENKASDTIPFQKYISRGMSSDSQAMFEEYSTKDLVRMLAKGSALGPLSMLHSYIAKRMMRRKLDDLMTGLPERVTHTVWVNPYDGTMRIDDGESIKLKGDYRQQAALYEMALREPVAFEELIVRGRKIEEHNEHSDEDKDHKSGTAQLTRLRQVATDPELFIPGCQSIKIDALEELTKMTLLDNGEFVSSGLIFNTLKTPARRLTERLREVYKEELVGHVDGGIKADDRPVEVTRFQGEKTKILSATIETMGTSGNLTQADCIYFMDLPWTASKIEQGIGRARRIDNEGRNYEGRKLHIYFIRYDAPVTIDGLMRLVTVRKGLLSDILIDRNLSESIIEAFRECGEKGVMESILEAIKNPPQIQQLETSLAERLNDIMKRITESGGTYEKNKELWTEAAIIYREFMEHKSSYYANMASLDILSGDEFPELKGRKLKTLDLCSATSTLQSAYQKMKPELCDREFEMDIYDFDANPGMLALGIPRAGRQILGKLKDVGKLEENSFDIVNLSYAYRYAEDPAQLLKDIRKILKDKGKLQLIIPKDNTFPPELIQTLTDDFGATVRVGPGKLHSRLDEASYEEAKETYGKKTADEVKKRAHAEVVYLVVEFNKDDDSNEKVGRLNNDELNKKLRLERRISVSAGIIERAARTIKTLNLPEGGTVQGEVMHIDLDEYTRKRREAKLIDIQKKIEDIKGLAKLYDSGNKAKGKGFDGFLKTNLNLLIRSINGAAPFDITEKSDIRRRFEDVRNSSNTCKKWLSSDNELAQEIERLLR